MLSLGLDQAESCSNFSENLHYLLRSRSQLIDKIKKNEVRDSFNVNPVPELLKTM